MPGEDRTGPMGKGPGTGRGLGRCGTPDKQSKDAEGAAENLEKEGGWGRGRGEGQGRGRGRGRGFGRGGGRNC